MEDFIIKVGVVAEVWHLQDMALTISPILKMD